MTTLIEDGRSARLEATNQKEQGVTGRDMHENNGVSAK